MVVKEYKKHAGVYKVQTFRTTQTANGTEKYFCNRRNFGPSTLPIMGRSRSNPGIPYPQRRRLQPWIQEPTDFPRKTQQFF